MAPNADAESGSEGDAFEDGDFAEEEWPAEPGAPSLLYSGGPGPLPGLPTRADLVRLGGPAASDKLETQLSGGGPVPFLPVSVAERAERAGGAQSYCLHLFGILATGAKAHVVLGGVEVSFDVRVPDGAEPAQFEHELRHFLSGSDRALRGGDLSPLEVRRHQKFPLMGYRAEPAAYLRLVYAHTAARRDAVAAARANGYETAEDDTGPYYPKASRQAGFPLAAWAVLRNYQWRRGGAHPLGEAPPRWGEPRSPRCEHVLRLSQSDYAPWVDPAAPPEARRQQADSLRKYPQLLRDRTLVLAWDIETHTSRAEQDLPLAERPEDTVFMIGLSLHWKDDAQPLRQVCLVQGATAEPDPRWTTVQCSDETALLEAFAALLGQFAPDLVVGFNDGQYDWPFVLEKARRAGLLGRFADEASALPGWKKTSEADASQFNLAETKIKLGADGYRWPVTYLRVPGWVAIDVRVMFMQIFPMAETGGTGGSLNYFLAACRLPPKADMPHNRLWRIFERKDAAGMRRGAHYCVNDAQRCQALLVKKNVVAERRELAALAFVTLSDAVYQAISHKVQNLVGAYAAREGLVGGQIPSRGEDARKYPGAWVFPPQKGMIPDPGAPGVADLERVRALCLAWGAPARLLPRAAVSLLHRCLAPPVPAGGDAPPNPEWPGYQPGRPVTGLDFSSLYPSIIMAYNFSPEMFVATEEEAAELEREGGRLHAVQFTMVGDREATRGWFLRAPPPYPEMAQAAGEAFQRRAGPVSVGWFVEKLLAFLGGGARKATGLYPQILEELYDQRASLKASLGAHEKAREAMDLAEARRASGEPWTYADELGAAPPPLLAAALESLAGAPDASARYAAFYAENAFLAQGLDSKQKALKVFMNSFYGGAGCRSSPAYLLPLAGGVTETGRYNIHLAADFVRAQGFRLLYGDTDSLYVAPPAAAFRQADEAYARAALGREAYWGAMVRVAMGEMQALRRGVNAHIAADNGTQRLRMAYEEVLFPTVFAGKKKYYGVAHVTQPNFRPKELLIKGLAVVQRGVSPLARVVGTRIMERSMALDNTQGLLDIVHSALEEALASAEWKFKDFVMSACWKPAKHNVAVVQFVRRMEARVAREKVANLDRQARGEGARPLECWVPLPGERFAYVLRPPADTHSLEGRKLDARKGELMEHAELAQAEGIRPDIAEYLGSYALGLCARFINFLFEDRAAQGGASPHDAKTFDKKCQDLAVAHLKRHLKSLQGGGNERALGQQYRAAYSGACGSCARAPLPAAAARVLRGENFGWKTFVPGHQAPGGVVAELADRDWQALGEELGRPGSPGHLRQQARLRAWAAALGVGPRGDDLRPSGADRPPRIFAAYAAYAAAPAGARGRRPPTIHERVQSAMERQEGDLRARLAALMGALAPIALRYETSFTNLVHGWRKKVAAQAAEEPEFDFGLAPREQADLAAYWGAWQALRAAHLARADRAAFGRHLEALKARRQGSIRAPPSTEIAQAIASGAQRLSPLGYAVQGGALG